MRIVAYGFVSSVCLILVADTAPVWLAEMPLIAESVPNPIGPQCLQGGALAALVGTVWYMLTRAFPAHLAAIKDQRDAFLAAIEKMSQKDQESE